MGREENVYRDLQKHLDKQPVGFPATRSGSDVRLLKRFFTTEEAELATRLSYRPRSLNEIYGDIRERGTSLNEVKGLLDRMVAKMVIGQMERGGVRYFFNVPLVVGMYEGQIYGLTRELLQDFDEYTSSWAFGLEFLSTELPQMRTIPVERSIQVEHHVATYDQLRALIADTNGPFVIHHCICRKAAELRGKRCKATARHETCLALGDAARNSIQVGKGREISREEALDIAALNQADGLVLQPSNSRKAEFICACCGCCCGMLRVHKMLPRPVDFWASNYYAAVGAETCTGCETCKDRCQVRAIALDKGTGVSKVNPLRCIGCGNCVAACPTGALRLVRKESQVSPPETWEDLYGVIMAHKKGVLGKIRLATRLILRR